MNIPTFDQLTGFIAGIKNAVTAFTNSKTTLLEKAESVLPVAGSVIDALAPGLTLGGINASKALSVVSGLAAAEPEITTAFGNLQAIAASGAGPTDAEWAVFNAAADKAHVTLQAANAAYQASV